MIGEGVLQGIADACLGGQVTNLPDGMVQEYLFKTGQILNIIPIKGKAAAALQLIQPCLLEGNIIVVVQIIDTNDRCPHVKEGLAEMKSDETGCAGDKGGVLRVRGHGLFQVGYQKWGGDCARAEIPDTIASNETAGP